VAAGPAQRRPPRQLAQRLGERLGQWGSVVLRCGCPKQPELTNSSALIVIDGSAG